MSNVKRLVAGLILIASATPAFADASADACRKAPTRACVLDAAEKAADKIQQPFWRADILARIAAAERRSGLDEAAASTLASATEAAKQIPADSKDGTHAPGFVAAQAEMGDWTGALDYARGLEKPFPKTSALATLALAEQRHNREGDAKAHFAQAIETANGAELAQRPFLLTLVARAQAKAGAADAATTFDLAIEADRARGKGLPGAIIFQRIRAGELDRALVDIMDLGANDRDFSLGQLVSALARAGRVDQGAEVASAIGDHSRAVEAWTDLAIADFRASRSFEGAQKLVKAAEIGKEEATASGKIDAIAEIAGAEAAGGMTERAKGHFAEARAALAAETDDTFRGSLAVKLALALARAGDVDGALVTLRPIGGGPPDPYLGQMADDLEAAHRPGEAFAVLSALTVDATRAGLLVELAERQPK